MGISRSDPIERRRLALLRQSAAQTNKFSIGGQEKKGGHAPRPISLVKMPWDKKSEDHDGQETE